MLENAGKSARAPARAPRKNQQRAEKAGQLLRQVQTFMIRSRAVTAQDWTFPRAQALPPYAFVVTDAVKARVRATGADIIDLGLGNPDRPTPPEIVARLHRENGRLSSVVAGIIESAPFQKRRAEL